MTTLELIFTYNFIHSYQWVTYSCNYLEILCYYSKGDEIESFCSSIFEQSNENYALKSSNAEHTFNDETFLECVNALGVK